MTTIQQYNIAQYLRLVRMLDAIQSSRAPTTMPAIETLGDTNASGNATWKKQRDELRYAVVARIINSQAVRAQQQQQQQQPGQAAVSPQSSAGYSTSGQPDDPRWKPYYYGPQDAMTGWSGDVDIDPFGVHGGGGIYRRDDTRVNRDYDPRTNGVFDRRVNIESDRRLNIHTDPRENY